ncbi:hypothetical protein M5E06_16570 [Azospirillum sp. A1-3]|uniref:hypothetical protein n=1 Tax=Azospirillum sp. A1-3 TaxID=185874 RepID=UPI0020778380|nr:hypothetical protein [Azospirillum sp. A1-3]MCM8735760.1 hypothetical protein [Azospirillum sp. A1-3]
MATRKPTAAEMTALLAFHAILSGAFVVAYLIGDEDTYGMHVFSGYTALTAIVLRLVIGLLAPAGSPLRLPRPSPGPVLHRVKRLVSGDPKARAERSPPIAWMAAALLVGVGLAAASGAVADFVVTFEDLHETLGEFSLYIVIAHVALVFGLHGLKRLTPEVPSHGTTQRSTLSDRVAP